MKTTKTHLSRDDTRGAAYGYRPLLDFIIGQGGVVGNYVNDSEHPFHSDKSGTTCTLYSDVTREAVLDAFEFDADVTITQGPDATFRLWDEKQWLQINFHSLAAKSQHEASDKALESERTRDSLVFDMKAKALDAAIPKTTGPKGRVRISVKPWRNAREAYYPVIEFAISRGCQVNQGEAVPDSYFVADSGGKYICQITGTLSAVDVLTEFDFDEGVIQPSADDQDSFVIYDTAHSILILVSGS